MLPAVDSRTFKVVGGNSMLPERLLAASGAHVKRGWVVDTIRPAKQRRFELHATRTDAPSRRHHKHGHGAKGERPGDVGAQTVGGRAAAEGGPGAVQRGGGLPHAEAADVGVEGSIPWNQVCPSMEP